MYSVGIEEPVTGLKMRKLAVGVDYICEPIKKVSTPAVVIDMFEGLDVPREQSGGSVDLLIGTDWLEHMPVPVERVHSMQLVQSLFSQGRILCGEVPTVRDWQHYRHAAERRRREANMPGPVPRYVHPQLMRPGEGPFPAPGGFVRERRLQEPPEVVTITSDEEEVER